MTISEADFDLCRQLVEKYTGIVLAKRNEYIVESRLKKIMRLESIDSIPTLLKLIRNDPKRSLVDNFVENFVNTETQFFRDRDFFRTLKTVVFPEIRDRLTTGQILNVWCAAASSGQEPYSVAIMLSEHFPYLAVGRVRLIGSDISQSILSRAREGTYKLIEVERGLDSGQRDKYFEGRGDHWQILPSMRAQIEFRRINLIDDWPPLPLMDMILMRNVLLYFSDQTKKLIIEKTKRQLKSGGYLFLGATEAPGVANGELERTRFGRTVCFRKKAVSR